MSPGRIPSFNLNSDPPLQSPSPCHLNISPPQSLWQPVICSSHQTHPHNIVGSLRSGTCLPGAWRWLSRPGGHVEGWHGGIEKSDPGWRQFNGPIPTESIWKESLLGSQEMCDNSSGVQSGISGAGIFWAGTAWMDESVNQAEQWREAILVHLHLMEWALSDLTAGHSPTPGTLLRPKTPEAGCSVLPVQRDLQWVQGGGQVPKGFSAEGGGVELSKPGRGEIS